MDSMHTQEEKKIV